MSSENNAVDRRDFLKTVGAAGLTLGAGKAALGARAANKTSGRVIGANDRINIGVIGYGGRGSFDAQEFAKYGEANKDACQIVAVCDVYEKRKRQGAERYKAKGFLDYREVLAIPDVDAVIVATPDHWHAKIALEAMDGGKDVYVEKPMCHTNDEIRALVNTVKETKRVLQVGSQTTSGDQWWKARKAIADGVIGQIVMSQGSYHRNSPFGEWNGPDWPIDKDAGPDGKGENFIDWKMWLGSAPKRPYDADRFFRFRKYWDYGGGIATDLFFHVVSPMQICWGEPQFPARVSAAGGIYIFKDEREVPDTFHLMADYPKGHSLVLSSSMANSQHIPGLIRGHAGTLIMVEHGRFESPTPNLIVRPEPPRDKETQGPFPIGGPQYEAKFGSKEFLIPVDNTKDMMTAHIENFLNCMRTREKPHLDVETAARAQVVINLSVQSYREGRTLFWDEKNWKASPKPVKA
jgi:predicted dehydrogenase